MGSYAKIKQQVKARNAGKRKLNPDDTHITSLRVKFAGRYDLERLSCALQIAIARLNDRGIDAVQNCNLYITPVENDIIEPNEGYKIGTLKGKFYIEEL